MIRVAAIDDHPLILKVVTDEINKQIDMRLVATADHGSKIHALVREHAPDVLLLDLGMTDGVFEPVSAVQTLQQEQPDVRVIILTGYNDPVYIRDLIEAGALGYVLKCENYSLELPRAIRTVYNGERFYSPAVLKILFAGSAPAAPQLTRQEIQVLRLVAKGQQNTQIAEVLSISAKRVSNILTDIYAKLGVNVSEGNQRIQAVNKAGELGILPKEKI